MYPFQVLLFFLSVVIVLSTSRITCPPKSSSSNICLRDSDNFKAYGPTGNGEKRPSFASVGQHDNESSYELISDSSPVRDFIDSELSITLNEAQGKAFEAEQKARMFWLEIGKASGQALQAMVDKVMPHITEVNSGLNVSAKCMSSLKTFATGLAHQSPWAMRMMDSVGKPSSGIFDGTISFLGSFDECLDIEGPNAIRGQYCLLKVSPPQPLRPPMITFKTRIFDFTESHLQKTVWIKYLDNAHILYEQNINIGFCSPSTCSIRDIDALVHKFSTHSPAGVWPSECHSKQVDNTLSPIQWVIVLTALGMLLMTLIGTIFELFYEREAKDSNRIFQYLLCFSMYSNGKTLLSTDSPVGSIDALHGIKVITMAWVNFGHTYELPLKAHFSGGLRFISYLESPLSQLLFNGFVTVDSFFGVSAFLFTYTLLKDLQKRNGKINLLRMVVNRVCRLTPTLWAALLLLTILPALSSGPFWREYFYDQAKVCESHWMATTFMFNNHLPAPDICLPHSWYISADLQMFLLSLPFIILLHRYSKVGVWVTSSFTMLSISGIAVATYIRNYPPLVRATVHQKEYFKDMEILYLPTYIHLGPYFLGVIFGYFLYKTEAKLRLKPAVNLLLWALALTSSAVSLLYSHSWNRGEPWSPLSAAIYGSLHRTGWTLGVVWVSFACASGNGGFINTFLSWKVFQPFSRLSYSMYLLTFPIFMAKYGYRRELIPMSIFSLLNEGIVNFTFVAIASAVSYLLIEGPLSRMTKLVLTNSFRWADICITQRTTL